MLVEILWFPHFGPKKNQGVAGTRFTESGLASGFDHWGHPEARRSRRGASAPSTPGSAERNYQRHLALAREAAAKDDTIEMENCYQHAEHFFRVMGANA